MNKSAFNKEEIAPPEKPVGESNVNPRFTELRRKHEARLEARKYSTEYDFRERKS